jgi:hypothetical protein
MGQFSDQVAAFAEKTGKKLDTVHKEVAVELFRRLIFRSPVGNPAIWKHPVKGYVGGRFRANWQVGVDKVGTQVDQVDAGGSATLAKGVSAIRATAAGLPIWMTNSLPYSVRLEQGWSQQAPAGVVGVTVVEFRQVIAEVLARTK